MMKTEIYMKKGCGDPTCTDCKGEETMQSMDSIDAGKNCVLCAIRTKVEADGNLRIGFATVFAQSIVGAGAGDTQAMIMSCWYREFTNDVSGKLRGMARDARALRDRVEEAAGRVVVAARTEPAPAEEPRKATEGLPHGGSI